MPSSKGQKYNKEWLTENEIKKLVESPFVDYRDRLLIKCLYYGALRISEILKAKLEDFFIQNEKAYLKLREQKKDKKNWETQPIPMHLFSDIKTYCDFNKIRTQDRIFPFTYVRAYQIVKDCCKKVGIDKKIGTHSFRRSRIQHMLNAGENPFFVKQFARHKSIDTTEIYLKISKESLHKSMKTI